MTDARAIYIHAAAAIGPGPSIRAAERQPLDADPDTSLGALVKSVLGQRLRQASHFVELAAVGARLCLNQTRPAPDFAVYFGTALGEIRRAELLFQQVFPPGPGQAAPFDFINANANVAAFYVARMAGVSARNLTLTQGAFSFELALWLACADLRAGAVSAALVGGVDENCFPRDEYLRRWNLRDEEIMGEGSGWLYLSCEPAGALAQLSDVHRLEPVSGGAAWATTVGENLAASVPRTILTGIGVTPAERAALAKVFPDACLQSYVEYCGVYPTAAGFGIAGSLENASAGSWAHVNRDTDGGTMLVAWRTPAG